MNYLLSKDVVILNKIFQITDTTIVHSETLISVVSWYPIEIESLQWHLSEINLILAIIDNNQLFHSVRKFNINLK